MRLLSPLNPSVENGISTEWKRHGKHASLTLLLVRDRSLTSQSRRRSIIIREISNSKISMQLLFKGLMIILISRFESVHLDQNEK